MRILPAALVILLVLATAGCSGEDRGDQAATIGEAVEELPGLRVTSTYDAPSLKVAERYLVDATAEAGTTDDEACAAVSAFLDAADDADFPADRADLTVVVDDRANVSLRVMGDDASSTADLCRPLMRLRRLPADVEVIVERFDDERPTVRIRTHAAAPSVRARIGRVVRRLLGADTDRFRLSIS